MRLRLAILTLILQQLLLSQCSQNKPHLHMQTHMVCTNYVVCLHCVVFVCMCKYMVTIHVTFREECGVNDEVEQGMN